MKNLFFLFIVLLIVQGCKKDDTKTGKSTQPTVEYTNAVNGSSWIYHEINTSDGTSSESDYTITSTDQDTSINSKIYHVYHYSFGGSQYLRRDGNDYYEFTDFNQIGQAFDRLYLKANAKINTSWSQNLNISDPNSGVSIPLKVNNQIADIGDRTVNGTLYKNVIHVKTTLSSSLIPAKDLQNDIDSYFAPSVGLIENITSVDIDYMGYTLNLGLHTSLMSALLK